MTQYLGLNISDEIADAITERTAITGESKTVITTIALEKELGIKKDLNLIEKVENLDIRMTRIESKLD